MYVILSSPLYVIASTDRSINGNNEGRVRSLCRCLLRVWNGSEMIKFVGWSNELDTRDGALGVAIVHWRLCYTYCRTVLARNRKISSSSLAHVRGGINGTWICIGTYIPCFNKSGPSCTGSHGGFIRYVSSRYYRKVSSLSTVVN
jgi:hypothetical protein